MGSSFEDEDAPHTPVVCDDGVKRSHYVKRLASLSLLLSLACNSSGGAPAQPSALEVDCSQSGEAMLLRIGEVFNRLGLREDCYEVMLLIGEKQPSAAKALRCPCSVSLRPRCPDSPALFVDPGEGLAPRWDTSVLLGWQKQAIASGRDLAKKQLNPGESLSNSLPAVRQLTPDEARMEFLTTAMEERLRQEPNLIAEPPTVFVPLRP
jgi:hypothetical protein